MKDKDETKEQVSELVEILQYNFESDKRFTDIINFLPDATFAIDLSGKVVVWNQAIEVMTGAKAEDMLGKGSYEYAMVFYGLHRPLLIDLVFGFVEEIEKKYVFVKKEGNVLTAEAIVPVRQIPHTLWGKAGPLYDNSGKVVGAIETIRDITAFKQSQKELQAANEELEVRIGKRSAELVEANKALQKEIFKRERTEAVLKESEGKYNQFFKTSRDCVFITSKDGRLIDLNDAAVELFGYSSREEILQMKIPYVYANDKEREKLILKLQETISQVKTLSGLLPICASCKKICDDKGYWKKIETYIRDHSEAKFSHSICPDCAKKLYLELYKET